MWQEIRAEKYQLTDSSAYLTVDMIVTFKFENSDLV